MDKSLEAYLLFSVAMTSFCGNDTYAILLPLNNSTLLQLRVAL